MPFPIGASQIGQFQGISWGDPANADSIHFVSGGLVVDTQAGWFSKGPAPWVDVRAYGAVGNGIVDDTAAIQNAINAAGPGRGAVYFSPGTYMVTPPSGNYALTVPYDYTTLYGPAGGRHFGATIKGNPASTSYKGILSWGAADNTLHIGGTIRDLTFQGNTAISYGGMGGSAYVLDLRWASSRIQNCRFEWHNGIHVDSVSGVTAIDNTYSDIYSYGMLTDNGCAYDMGAGTDNQEFLQCKAAGYQVNNTTAQGGRSGFRIAGGHFKAKQCHPFYFKLFGLEAVGCQDMEIDGGEWESNGSQSGDCGIFLNAAFRSRVVNISAYHNFGPAVLVQNGANNVIGYISDIAGSSPNGGVEARSIYINGASRTSVIGCANLSGATAQSITLDGSAHHCSVVGNQCALGIVETSGCTNNVYTGNVVATGGISVQSGSIASLNILS